MPTIALTIVVDNKAQPGCLEEHGFSLFIAVDNQDILLDTGQGPALAPNIKNLGLRINQLDHLVLSHGHYDHCGGLPWVLFTAPQCQLWCHPAAVEPGYSIRDTEVRTINMPPQSRRALHALPATRLHWSSNPLWITSRIGLTGTIPRKTDFEDPGGPFFLDPQGQRPDPIDDDQALWIMTDQGLVVCVGCCHAGLVNTLTYIQKITGEQRIRTIIGGLHLAAASDLRLQQTINILNELQPELLIPCHCTGDQAVEHLKHGLDFKVQSGYAGLCLTL